MSPRLLDRGTREQPFTWNGVARLFVMFLRARTKFPTCRTPILSFPHQLYSGNDAEKLLTV